MRSVIIAMIQGNFRNAFQEKYMAIQEISDNCDGMNLYDFKHNQELLIKLIREAADKGAELVVTPESYLDGWSVQQSILDQMVTSIDGVFVDELKALASELNIWICAGVFIREKDCIFNTALLIDSSGDLKHVYRKTHETKGVLDQIKYDLGNDLSVVDTPWGKMGMLVCHDRWYPENYRTLRIRGAEFILIPTMSATLWPGHPYYEIHRATLRSHAYANSLFIMCCNGANHGGYSIGIAPNGEIISQGELNQEIVLCNIEPSKYTAYDFVTNLNHSLHRDIFKNKKGDNINADTNSSNTLNRDPGNG